MNNMNNMNKNILKKEIKDLSENEKTDLRRNIKQLSEKDRIKFADVLNQSDPNVGETPLEEEIIEQPTEE